MGLTNGVYQPNDFIMWCIQIIVINMMPADASGSSMQNASEDANADDADVAVVQRGRQRPRRAAPIPLHKLIDCLLVGRLLRSTESLQEVVVRSVAIALGSDEASAVNDRIKQRTMQIPAATQLSHARLRLDLLLMQLRKSEWRRLQQSSEKIFVCLSADSSPQGLDFLVTIEDRIRNPGMVIEATRQELAQFSLSDNVRTSTLPPLVVGSGRSDTASKFELLMRSIMLDVGPDSLTAYGESVVGFCSDFGVESHLTQDSHHGFCKGFIFPDLSFIH